VHWRYYSPVDLEFIWRRNMDLRRKNALITGGNRGIGRAVAIALAKKGVNVAVHFFRNEDATAATRKAIEDIGGKSIQVKADVKNLEQVQSMMHTVKEDFGGLEILVNNAGTSGPHSSLILIDEEEWEDVIDVNLTGVFNCCRAAVLEFQKGLKKIVNMSSISGKMGGKIGCHYAASKAGVIGLTFALASELAPDVWVNAVAPGPVNTEFLTPELKDLLSKATPFGRVAEPEEIAHTVVYLLENDYVSGEVIDVNAGRYMD
jgi:3-oxoacyl-[acyl-carrier protein] reductase